MQVPELIVAEYENLEVKPLFGGIILKVALRSTLNGQSRTSIIGSMFKGMERKRNGLVQFSIGASYAGRRSLRGVVVLQSPCLLSITLS